MIVVPVGVMADAMAEVAPFSNGPGAGGVTIFADEKSDVTLTCNDGDKGIRALLPRANAATWRHGNRSVQFQVPAAPFLNICRLLNGDDPMDMRLTDGRVKIQCRGTVYWLNVVDGGWAWPKMSYYRAWHTSVDDMVRMIGHGAYGAARQSDAYMPEIAGTVMVKLMDADGPGGRKLSMVSTNGILLAMTTEYVDCRESTEFAEIMDLDGLLSARAHWKRATGSMAVCVGKEWIGMRATGGEVVIRRRIGKYPPYDGIVFDNADAMVIVDRAALIGPLKRAAIMAPADNARMSIGITKRGGATVKTANAELWMMEERIPAAAFERVDTDMDIVVNVRMLLDALLRQPQTDQIEIATAMTADTRTRIRIRPVDAAGSAGDLAVISLIVDRPAA